MGTDIHLAVERREPEGWVLQAGEDDGWYDGRNYALFAMLASVRNGQGFAGIDTGDPVEPIAPPRGIPGDASLDVRVWHAEWEGAEHSASWLSLRELLAVDWHDSKMTRRGFVDPEGFWRFDKGWKLEEWCGDVSGAKVEKVSNTEMLRRIQDLEVCTPWTEDAYVAKHGRKPAWEDGRTYTQITWQESWLDAIGNFAGTILSLGRVSVLHKLSPDDVRIVFFFDN